jgi:hypothetical protein
MTSIPHPSDPPSRRAGSRRWRRGDLERRPLPVFDEDGWTDPAERLQDLYRWATDEARRSIAWYQTDKVYKRDGSRLLRALSIVLAAAGGLAPLLRDVFGTAMLTWGYVLLAAAAGCLAFDRFFGLSTAWMRDMAMINTIQRRLVEFELDWVAPHFAAASTPATMEARFIALRQFGTDLSDLLDGEIAEWRTEFTSGLEALRSNGAPPARPDAPAPPA